MDAKPNLVCQLYDPDQTLTTVSERLQSQGWIVIPHDETSDAAVGLADAKALHDNPVALPQIPWVGLVEKEQLNDCDFAQFLLNCFSDFHLLPANQEQLELSLSHLSELQHLQQQLPPQRLHDSSLCGLHASMKVLLERINKIAPTDHTVLIQGESGSGKELVAQELHHRSGRCDQPWLAVNCAALPENLFQAELFGCEKGAFTSANASRVGKFEAAEGGTLFLDEIGELSLESQASLLRALEEKAICRLGCNKMRKIDVRVIAATNVDLETSVKKGNFRADLYYRLCALKITIPPLRDRGSDVLILANHFLKQLAKQQGSKPKKLTIEARWQLLSHHWPGNIRELKNTIVQGHVISEGDHIGSTDMGFEKVGGEIPSLCAIRQEAELKYLENLVTLTDKNISKAAIHAGISRGQLYRLLSKYDVGL